MLQIKDILKNPEHKKRMISYFRLPIHLKAENDDVLNDLNFLHEIKEIDLNDIGGIMNHDLTSTKLQYNEDDLQFIQLIDLLSNELKAHPKYIEELEKEQKLLIENYSNINTNAGAFYSMSNDNKFFLSLDLKAACWQTVQHITGMKQSYEDWVSERTTLILPVDSKTVRTKICGKLDQKIIRSYNQNLLLESIDELIEAVNKLTGTDITIEQLNSIYADEIIFELTPEQYDKAINVNQELTEKELFDLVGLDLHFSAFKLVHGANKTFIKIFNDGSYELKMISPKMTVVCKYVEYITLGGKHEPIGTEDEIATATEIINKWRNSL